MATTALDGLDVEDIAALTRTQILGLIPAQLSAMNEAQAAALTTTNLAALTVTQVRALGASAISALSETQLGALTTPQIAAFSATQAQVLSARTALRPEHPAIRRHKLHRDFRL